MARQSKGKISDLIFKELIKRGYSLEGKTRVWNIADSKLWYLSPEQAQAYLDLEKSEGYQKNIIKKEIDLINNHIDEIIDMINNKKINIIDLGCGDGKKAVLFTEHLKGKTKIRYCPIDISSYMVEKAIKNVKKTDVEQVINLQWNISDFENLENITAILREGEFKNNLILLLGNTLGNFEINELLYEIRSAMNEGDLLLIGNGLNNNQVDTLLKSYGDKKNNEFLIKIIERIGLNREDVEFRTRFNNSRVEMYYVLKEDKKIKFLEKTIEFKKGDIIIVAVSYKYTKEDFISFLNLYFDEVMVKISKDGSYCLALCKK